MVKRPQKITLGEMRSVHIRGLLIYCADYKCGHSVDLSGDRWPDDVRLSDLEPLFTCTACGHHGAEIRPDFATRDRAPVTPSRTEPRISRGGRP